MQLSWLWRVETKPLPSECTSACGGSLESFPEPKSVVQICNIIFSIFWSWSFYLRIRLQCYFFRVLYTLLSLSSCRSSGWCSLHSLRWHLPALQQLTLRPVHDGFCHSRKIGCSPLRNLCYLRQLETGKTPRRLKLLLFHSLFILLLFL
jgi:hypothetical protein